VVRFLDRLLAAATEGRRGGSVIDIQLTRALVLHTSGNLEPALEALGVAVRLAEPERYVRTFVDEGTPMADLLAAAERRASSPYIRRLRSAFATRAGEIPEPRLDERRSDPLIDPLSNRERDVLRLLDTELNGPDIARELVVSLNTVRTHTKNLYMKLGVTSRRAAVVRAKELDLL
jgi:LuxR family maltose regulon positive regulatory protein